MRNVSHIIRSSSKLKNIFMMQNYYFLKVILQTFSALFSSINMLQRLMKGWAHLSSLTIKMYIKRVIIRK